MSNKNSDFKVEITQQKGLSDEDTEISERDSVSDENDSEFDKDVIIISVCLKCTNKDCLTILEEAKKDFEDEVCLIRIKLTIYKENYIYKYGKKSLFFKAYLNDFYNNVTKYGKGISYLNQKLKGGGKAMFAMLLIRAIQSNVLTNDDIILLEASGDENESENMLGLIQYYEKLGFTVLNKATLQTQIEDQSVMMFGKVQTVIHNVTNSYSSFSPELVSIINQM